MAKPKVKYTCPECGFETAKWLGRCPGCGAWNTLVEEIVTKPAIKAIAGVTNAPLSILSVTTEREQRMVTGIDEFDRVMGGGIVLGSLFLVGGDPGIGKSTLLMQVAGAVTRYGKVLYVSGEESIKQVRMRAERLGILHSEIYLMAENNMDAILAQAEQFRPALMIVDSIQTMCTGDITSTSGSVSQVRECTGRLMRLAKNSQTAIAVVGHVTKEGSIAGPRMLEHMVDVVLYFEGERHYSFRVLRAVKNRFGSTNESGMFSMEEQGLCEVANPSELFLRERPENQPGSVIVAHMEGTRPLLVEVQALVSQTVFGMPRRMAVGIDYNRLVMLTAVLEKKLGLQLQNQDIYINVVGGLKIDEPAIDLGIVMAIYASFYNRPIPSKLVAMGEIGLTGEVRAVVRLEERLQEAAKLGFTEFIIPSGSDSNAIRAKGNKLTMYPVANVTKALEVVGR